MRNKTLPIPQLGFLLNRSRTNHNNKHAVAGYVVCHQNCEIQKRSLLHEQEYLCYMKIRIVGLMTNGLVAVIGKYLISAHLYSTTCVLQT